VSDEAADTVMEPVSLGIVVDVVVGELDVLPQAAAAKAAPRSRARTRA
jgi:hypothetical protein